MQNLLVIEPSDSNNIVERQESIRLNLHRMFTWLQLNRAIWSFAYQRSINGDDRIHGRCSNHHQLAGLLTHTQSHRHGLFVTDHKRLANVVIAFLLYVHSVVALAQQYAIADRKPEPATCDLERIGARRVKLELNRLGRKQQVRCQ